MKTFSANPLINNGRNPQNNPNRRRRVSNYGVIVGGDVGFGVEMSSGGVITNHAGTISAASGILIFGEAGTVTNYGQILGVATRTGVQLSAGGTIINRSGTISGGIATEIFAGGTVVNYATILGLGSEIAAAYFGSGFRNVLEIAPGSTIVGMASGGNTIGATAVSTLELITGTAAGVIGTVGVIGTFGQAGANYVNFADIVVDPGASWAFKNTQTIAANETLTDNGTLTNNGIVLTPVALGAGATVIDAQGAQISDFGFNFIYAVHDSGAGVVVNDGLIAGGAHDGGVGFYGGGTVTNQAQGTITAAAYAGVGIFGAPGTVINNGVIQGSDNGVFFSAGGTIVNLAGTIGAARFDGVGIYSGPGTVVNFATIVGGTLNAGAVYLSANFADRVVIGAGAVFVGEVSGGNTIGSTVASTLELTTGASAGVIGTIGGIGSQYVDFADIVVDPGASWVVAATQTLAAGYTLTDNGTLTNDGRLLTAVTIGSAAKLTNAQGAVVEGGQFGVIGSGGPATVVNDGLLTAFSSGSVGVDVAGGGAVTNQTNGVIAGYFGVVGYNATVVNAGFISGIAGAVEFFSGGSVTNSAGGRIIGRSGVVITGGAGTVVNSGLIGEFSSHSYGISLPGGFANRVVDNPGASFAGVVGGGNPIVGGIAASTLELGAGTQTGTLSGLGSQFIDFSAVTVDPGATWSFARQNDIAAGATLTDAGTLALNGQVQVDGKLTETSHLLTVGQGGTGELLIENQGVVVSIQPASASVGLDIGRGAGDAGDVVVTGPQARLLSAGQFVVGDAGSGSLAIRNGATVGTKSGGIAGLAGAVIANGSGAAGSSVNVTGAGSDWQVGGALNVGSAATGMLGITDGATVTASTLDAGVGASGAGVVTVSGPKADLVITGTVTIGDAGSGELSILDGANATIGGDLNVANAGTGTGNVDIEDTTGTITFGGNILVGFNGFGVFNIGFNVNYIQNNGGIIFGPDSSGAINSFADPSPFLSNSSPSPIAIGAQGVDQLAAYLFNSGEFTTPNNHSLTFDTPIISGGGSFALGSGDSLVLNADTVAGQTFTLGSNDKLTIGIDQLATIDLPASGTGPFTPETNPNKGDLLLGNFDGVIANFSPGDTIDVDTYLSSASAGTLSQNGSVVSVIEIANGDTLGVLRFDTAANATAAIADDAITLVPCFAAGTRIATARGEVAVEAIGVGDRVQVLLGGRPAADRFAEVIWVGRREVDCLGHPTPRKVWPGRPDSEVFLSPDHAIYFNDVLIPIKHLINGTTIAQVHVDRITNTTSNCPNTTCCWPRACRQRVSWICGTARSMRTGPDRRGCIRIIPPGCGRRSAARGWSSRDRNWPRRERWQMASRVRRPKAPRQRRQPPDQAAGRQSARPAPNAAADHSSFSTSPARYSVPQISTLAGPGSRAIAASASATCGPGRATPPDAATIASTGSAECCPGSATAHSVAACGSSGRKNPTASLLSFIPTIRCTGRSAQVPRCTPSTSPAPGLCPPSSHSSHPGGRRRANRPCSRCSRAGHSAAALPAPIAAAPTPGRPARSAAMAIPALSNWCAPGSDGAGSSNSPVASA